MGQEQEMNKTSKAQRLALNTQCSTLILPLGVGRWVLDVGCFLLL
jgi:hypothetical protein